MPGGVDYEEESTKTGCFPPGRANYDNSAVIKNAINRIVSVYPIESQNSRLRMLDLAGLRLFNTNMLLLMNGLFSSAGPSSPIEHLDLSDNCLTDDFFTTDGISNLLSSKHLKVLLLRKNNIR